MKSKLLALLFVFTTSLLWAHPANAASNPTPEKAGPKHGDISLMWAGCFASPSLYVGSYVEAGGFGRCTATPPLNLGVTVVLYHNGWYVNSSYKACPIPQGGGDCYGVPVQSGYTSGNWCARITLDYIDPTTGNWTQSSSSNGSGCP